MSNSGKSLQIPATFEHSPSPRPPGGATGDPPVGFGDPRVPLLNLSTLSARMDSLQQFLSNSVNNNTLIGKNQMEMVSTEIASAIHQIFVNGAALLSCSQITNLSAQSGDSAPKNPQIENPSTIISTVNGKSLTNIAADLKDSDNLGDDDMKIPTMTTNSMYTSKDKGVADLKVEAMDEETKDEIGSDDWEIIELDAVELLAEHIHFCDICDLKSHLKHCGESKWRCSCGTSFSRKDKLFGHMALFEGHMPAIVEEDEKSKGTAMVEDEEDEDLMMKEAESGANCSDNGFFDGLLEGFGSIDNYYLPDVLGSPNGGLGTEMNEFYNF
ncbi:hypothetical protein F0562_005532 [Nyssa sinensis]|uniref:STOP1/2-like C2H2-type zinc finger domain-containing protein n=1 Tax=Nyssa sinensis TaxID=561372 RepID=A0A5J5AKR9_9ASTE|nr:hypothetical protein F0562_005532 [Nyssa sinensis]